MGPTKGRKGEGVQVANVVKNLGLPLYGRVVVIIIFFTSINLFLYLQACGTFVAGTIRNIYIGIPNVLKDKNK